jgi:hypothetical protein
MAQVLGTMSTGAVITTDTPIYQADDTTTANMTYIRWENVSVPQLIQRVNETSGTIIQFTTALWANRATATYTP